MEELFRIFASYVALGLEAAAVLVVAIAGIEALWRAMAVFLGRSDAPDRVREIARLHLARWLAVALEFTLAADILRTAVAPTWEEIGKLAAIAALRTLLNYFLQQEIENHDRRHGKETDASRGDLNSSGS